MLRELRSHDLGADGDGCGLDLSPHPSEHLFSVTCHLAIYVLYSHTDAHSFALVWWRETFLIARSLLFLLFFFSSWKKMKSSIYSMPVINTRKQRISRKLGHK